MIKSVEFRKKKDKSWQKLEYLLSQADKRGLASLTPQELEEIASLYRMTASSLHVVRAICLDESLNKYLESLVIRAFFVVYASSPKQINPLSDFFLNQFPCLFRKYFLCHLVAFVIMLLGVIAGFWATLADPSNYFAFVDKQYAQGRTPFASYETMKKSLESGRDISQAEKTLFFSQLFTHNTKVGFMTFTLGIALGVPTFFLLVMNGGILGAMGAAFYMHNLSPQFWAWILAHGVTELLAVILCAGAGFIMAMGVLLPGKHGRLQNLKMAAKEAGLTVMGTVPMFLLAGIIEAFFRQTYLPDSIRFSFAGVTLLFWIVYLGLVGKKQECFVQLH